MIAAPATAVLRLRAELAALEPARAQIRRVLREEGWGGEAEEGVLLAASEALTNAIEHGSETGAIVEMELEASPERVLLRVIDGGRRGSTAPLGPRPAPPPSSERGRGLLIMRALAERLEVREAGAGTELRLEFRAPARLAA
jgi:serine/threonine-protein kinase RsbW